MKTRKEYLANLKIIKKNNKANVKALQLVNLKSIEDRLKHSKDFK